MPDWIVVLRWIHVLSASAWFGEVVVINVVLIPALSGRHGAARREMLATIFPKVFRLASVLATTTTVTGGHPALPLHRRGLADAHQRPAGT